MIALVRMLFVFAAVLGIGLCVLMLWPDTL